jgi:hypothetical protein
MIILTIYKKGMEVVLPFDWESHFGVLCTSGENTKMEPSIPWTSWCLGSRSKTQCHIQVLLAQFQNYIAQWGDTFIDFLKIFIHPGDQLGNFN